MMMMQKTVARSSVCAARTPVRSCRLVSVRAAEPGSTPPTPESTPAPVAPVAAPVAAAVAAVPSAPMFLGPIQEAINGRAAMLGIVSAIASEIITGESVVSQLAGRYVNGDLVEKPVGQSELLFGAVISILTLATLMPKLIENLEPNSRSFLIFTPKAEQSNGRFAMMGFFALVIYESIAHTALFAAAAAPVV